MIRAPLRLRPVHPNAGITDAYAKRLDALIKAMAISMRELVAEIYADDDTPKVAMDDVGTPKAKTLIAAMRQRGKIWQRRFETLAPDIARQFADSIKDRSDAAFAASLRKAGFTVRFSMTPGVANIVQASVGENVSLITSIPQQYLTNVEGAVMRSVAVGGDVGALAKALQEQFGVTKRRARFIAQDQNSKATSAIVRARQVETGITTARWLHSGGGKTQRAEHVAFAAGKLGGPYYDVRKGAFLDGIQTWPGHEINCRCVSIPVIPGLTRPQ